MKEYKCPNCGAGINTKTYMCDYCGAQFEKDKDLGDQIASGFKGLDSIMKNGSKIINDLSQKSEDFIKPLGIGIAIWFIIPFIVFIIITIISNLSFISMFSFPF